MNPYQAPKSAVAEPEDVPWLSRELRRAVVIPPLLVAPLALIFAFIAEAVETSREAFFLLTTGKPLAWALALTAAAYIAQLTYGALCYALLRRLRMLSLAPILVASLFPVVVAALVFMRTSTDIFALGMYVCFALVVGGSSWYFAVRRNERRAL